MPSLDKSQLEQLAQKLRKCLTPLVVEAHEHAYMLDFGRVEHAVRLGHAITLDDKAVRDAILQRPDAALILSTAARMYSAHLDKQIEEQGGTIYRRTLRWSGSQRTVEHSVRHYRRPVAQGQRRSPRARGSGHPRTRTVSRASSRSADSGDSEPGSDEPGPGSRLTLDRLAARPLQPRRDLLRHLAVRTGALDELVRGWVA